MENRQAIYEELCRVLTDYEGNGSDKGAGVDDLYNMLVKIQNCWETIITTDGSDDDNEVMRGDCLSCSNSMSVPAENDEDADRLFCIVKQNHVSEDGSCDEYN